jgi:hypothetical protein
MHRVIIRSVIAQRFIVYSIVIHIFIMHGVIIHSAIMRQVASHRSSSGIVRRAPAARSPIAWLRSRRVRVLSDSHGFTVQASPPHCPQPRHFAALAGSANHAASHLLCRSAERYTASA